MAWIVRNADASPDAAVWAATAAAARRLGGRSRVRRGRNPAPSTCSTCEGAGWCLQDLNVVPCTNCDAYEKKTGPAAKKGACRVTKATAWAQLEAKAAEVRKEAIAAGAPVTAEKAIVLASELHPELVAAWRAAPADTAAKPLPTVKAAGATDHAAATLQSIAQRIAADTGVTLSAAHDQAGRTPAGAAALAKRAAERGRAAEARYWLDVAKRA